MNKILITLAVALAAQFNTQATVVYQKQLEGQEFQIGVMLTWATQVEDNSSMFMVEKSENGIDYTNIGTVTGAGNSKKSKEYNFLDVMASSPFIYYRLKQIDVDGSFSFTDVMKLKKTISNNFMVARMSSPSASKEFTATLDVFKEGDLRYELRDLEGKVLFASVQPMVNGLNDITVSLADQKPNLYKIYFIFDKEEESLVIEKTLDEMEKKQNVATNPSATGRH